MSVNKSRSIRKRICASVVFLAVIAYVLIGFYTGCWTWSLFVFLSVPLMPVLLGLENFHISYELLVVAVYLTLGFTIHGWHPWWVLFLSIPVYHILFDRAVLTFGWKKKQKPEEAVHEAEWTEKE